MKIIRSLWFICLVTTCSSFGMDNKKTILSLEEYNCIEWFESNKRYAQYAYQDLSTADKTIINKEKRDTHTEQQLKDAIDRYSEKVLLQLDFENIDKKYDKNILSSALFKVKNFIKNGDMSADPIDFLTARLYVYSQLLTDEDRNSTKREKYLKNLDATRQAMQKYANLLADQLEKFDLLNGRSKQEISDYWFNKKMNDLSHLHTN